MRFFVWDYPHRKKNRVVVPWDLASFGGKFWSSTKGRERSFGIAVDILNCFPFLYSGVGIGAAI